MTTSPTRSLVAAGRASLLSAAKAAALAMGALSTGGRGARRDVTAVFPELSRLAVWWVAAEIQSHRLVGALFRRGVARWGEAWLQAAIDVRGREVLERLRVAGKPIVAVSWHAGAPAVATAGLARCGLRGVLLRYDPPNARTTHGFVQVETGADPRRKAHALMTAVQTLRRGEAVVFFAGSSGPPLAGRDDDQPFLGRVTRVTPSAAAMARLGGAALVPIEARLEAGRIVLEVFEPLPVGSDDKATTRRLSDFFAQRLRLRPGSFWRWDIGYLAQSPRA